APVQAAACAVVHCVQEPSSVPAASWHTALPSSVHEGAPSPVHATHVLVVGLHVGLVPEQSLLLAQAVQTCGLAPRSQWGVAMAQSALLAQASIAKWVATRGSDPSLDRNETAPMPFSAPLT